jgi:hypothetical protein
MRLSLSVASLAFGSLVVLSGVASFGCSGAGSEAPLQAPTTAPPPSGSPGVAPPPVAAGCEREPEVRADPASATAWRDWSLKCRPIEPADPIEGESIEAMLPYPSRGAGPCTAAEISLQERRQGDETVIVVDGVATGDCSSMAGLSVASLGKLKAGRYRMELGDYHTSFVVRPAGSDPGQIPEPLRLAIEVARAHAPGTCFGMPSVGDDPMRDLRRPFEETRAGTLMRKAFPSLGERERELLYSSATSITVTPAGNGSWTYAFTDGKCCTINQVAGDVARRVDGTVSVSAPRVVSSTTVPC